MPNEVIEVEQPEPTMGLTKDEMELMLAYLVFANGDGLKVYNDLMETFYYFESDGFNEELDDIPDPYREYVKAGCRKVMDKIRLITTTAGQMR